MDRAEGRLLLEHKVSELRKLSYEIFEKWQQERHVECVEIQASTGRFYQIESQAIRDDVKNQNGNIRVLVSIDDAALGHSLTESFIIEPDDNFVGE